MNNPLDITIPDKPQKNGQLVAEELEEEGDTVYTDVEHDASFSLNATASAILELCDGNHSPEDIADIVCETLSSDREQILKDTRAILEEFAAYGLIS